MIPTGLKGALSLLAAALALAAVAAPAAATGGNPPAPYSSKIAAARQKAAELSQLIAAENEKEQIASERYDEDTVTLSSAQKRLGSLESEVRRESAAIGAEKRLVQRAAVEAYVYGDSASEQFSAALESSIDDASTLTTYAGVATRALDGEVTRLNRAEQRLEISKASEQSAVHAARAASTAAASERRSAIEAEQDEHGALAQVHGEVARLLAEQAAAEAAAAEAAARARNEAAAENAATLASDLAELDPAALAAAERAQTAAALASEQGRAPLRPAGSSPAGNLAVSTAEHYLGVPYVWGGAGPSGFDCSGLTMVAWAAAGVMIDHSAWYQYRQSTPVPLSQIEPGDLLFYYFPNDGSDPITHVAMYVGSGPWGAETIIQAPETGETVSYSPMYYTGFVAAGRP